MPSKRAQNEQVRSRYSIEATCMFDRQYSGWPAAFTRCISSTVSGIGTSAGGTRRRRRPPPFQAARCAAPRAVSRPAAARAAIELVPIGMVEDLPAHHCPGRGVGERRGDDGVGLPGQDDATEVENDVQGTLRRGAHGLPSALTRFGARFALGAALRAHVAPPAMMPLSRGGPRNVSGRRAAAPRARTILACGSRPRRRGASAAPRPARRRRWRARRPIPARTA